MNRAQRYGRALRDAQRRAELTDQELAERLGVTRSAISRWVHGDREIPMDAQIAAARVLECRVLDLFPPMTSTGRRAT
jgi:transcriptional regulator with XRE-family HTH domain